MAAPPAAADQHRPVPRPGAAPESATPATPATPESATPEPATPAPAGPTGAGGAAGARWEAAMAAALRTPTWVRLLPVLLLVADLLMEWSIPSSVAAGFLLTVVPVVVAFSGGPGLVAGSTAVTVGLQALLALRAGHLTEQHHLWTYLATALAGAMGAGLAVQRRRQARDLVRMRAVADTLQHTVLRPVPARAGGLRAAGLYHPAEADVGIGGDLYEVCETRYGTRILLGDVRGKGLDAVRTVADVIGAFRVAAHETAELGELADKLDRHVRRTAERDGDRELFVTAVLVQHRPGADRIDLVNRGHLAPLLLAPGSVGTAACPEDLPLGLGHLAGPAGPPATVPLPPGRTLLLHTDGLTEARDRTGAFYPLAARLATLPATGPDAVVAFLDRDVRRHAGSLTDDVAVLAFATA
ncbi:PP2C family protein-serine/threonine phosphatase [Kitasatospora phosalacinea]|uniref:PP2C family protein-serine/threonine phosphatase n=1 Tax=Kitasatospora phosalacinea TaxID=2065 RepID=UPI0012FF0D60|nr:PP2C family protein-serine/threonine phosphatase [Kitasatospora phosalacinea]